MTTFVLTDVLSRYTTIPKCARWFWEVKKKKKTPKQVYIAIEINKVQIKNVILS